MRPEVRNSRAAAVVQRMLWHWQSNWFGGDAAIGSLKEVSQAFHRQKTALQGVSTEHWGRDGTNNRIYSCHASFWGLCILHLKDMILRQIKPGTQLLCITGMIFVAFFFRGLLRGWKKKKIGKQIFTVVYKDFFMQNCLLSHAQPTEDTV